MSWRDAITLDAIAGPPRMGCDRQIARRRSGGWMNVRGDFGERAPSELERDKREVSGLNKSARERAWKGGLR